MNSNSFQIKGWSITIASALLAIYATTKYEYLLVVGCLPTAMFWILDAYYLQQERKFRGIYNDVAGISAQPRETILFELRPDLYIDGKYTLRSSFTSITIINLYLSIIILFASIFIYSQY